MFYIWQGKGVVGRCTFHKIAQVFTCAPTGGALRQRECSSCHAALLHDKEWQLQLPALDHGAELRVEMIKPPSPAGKGTRVRVNEGTKR